MYSLGLNSLVLSYADDTKLISKSCDSLRLQLDIDKIANYCRENSVFININKSKVLTFGDRESRTQYYIDGVCIDRVQSYKDLGIVYDGEYKFSLHIDSCVKRSFKLANLILRTTKSKNPDLLIYLFKVFVRPLIEYNCSIYNPYLLRDIDLLESLQRRYTKRVGRRCGFIGGYRERLKFFGLESLEERRIRADLILLYKVLHNLISVRLDSIYVVGPCKTRGNSNKLFKYRAETEIRKRFFAFRVIDIWNRLPDSLANACSLLQFKNSLSSSDLSMYIRGRALCT
jgi:hypothetical protein